MKTVLDQIIVRPDPRITETKTGIVLPGKAAIDLPFGEVVCVGDGFVTDSGARTPVQVKAGDRVVFNPMAERSSELLVKKSDGTEETLLIMRESAILVVLEGDEKDWKVTLPEERSF